MNIYKLKYSINYKLHVNSFISMKFNYFHNNFTNYVKYAHHIIQQTCSQNCALEIQFSHSHEILVVTNDRIWDFFKIRSSLISILIL